MTELVGLIKSVIRFVLGVVIFFMIAAAVSWLGKQGAGLFVPGSKESFWRIELIAFLVVGLVSFGRTFSIPAGIFSGIVGAFLVAAVMGVAWIIMTIASPCHSGCLYLLTPGSGLYGLLGFGTGLGIFSAVRTYKEKKFEDGIKKAVAHRVDPSAPQREFVNSV